MKSAFPSGTRTIVAIIGVQVLHDVIRSVRFILTGERQTVTGSWAFGRVGLALARATTDVPNRRIVPFTRCSREREFLFR